MTATVSSTFSERAEPLPVRRPTVTVGAVVAMLAATGVVAAVGLLLSIEVAGILFVGGIFTLAAVRPPLAFVFMLATAPFGYDVGGGPVNMAAADLSMVIALGAFVATGRARLGPNPLRWTVLAYFVVCLVSSVLNGVLADSVPSMVQMAVYTIGAVFVFSGCVRRAEDLYPALYAMLAVDLFLVIVQIVSRSNFVLGLHKNAVGTHMGFGTVVAVGLWLTATDKRRRRQLALVAGGLSVGLLLSLSRGAWLGTACGIVLMFALRGRLLTSLKFVAAATPVVVVCWMLLPEQSKEYATDLRIDSHNIKARLDSIDFAMTYFKQSPIVGVGVGLRKVYDATNVVMSTLAETGVLGLATFSSIFATLYWMTFRAARRLDYTDSAYPLLIVGAALVTAKLVHGLVDHYWGRGILPAWAGAGMIVYAYGRARRSARGVQ
ncbi:MAG: O-antigen ligase family protein [Phycisphaerae bacterium]|nr:O-antigen ligase family protein [Tepidisphaeraceae bacterium]